MNNYIIRFALLALLLAATPMFTSCATTPKGTMEITAVTTPDGAIIVQTMTMTATVKAINAKKRKVTLVYEGGGKSTYKAGPEVVNFDQIQVGDKVIAKVTEEVAIYIGSGAPPSGSSETAVALAPVGEKPGGVFVETQQITVKIITVDAAKQKVTFQLPDDTTKTVKVGNKVDLSNLHAGDNVTVQVTEGLAITVEKPGSLDPNDSQKTEAL